MSRRESLRASVGIAAMMLIAAFGVWQGYQVQDRSRVDRLYRAVHAAMYAARSTYLPHSLVVGYGGTCGDGTRVDRFGYPGTALGAVSLERASDAAANLIPSWLADGCAADGHGGDGVRLEYIRVVAYRPGEVDLEAARKAADAAAKRVDPGAEVTRLQMLAAPPRVLVRVHDAWHEAEGTREGDDAIPQGRLDRWGYEAYISAVQRSRFLGYDIAPGPVPSFTEYVARLRAAPRHDPAYIRASTGVAGNLWT